MQYLELKKMIFHAYHGVLEEERKQGNTYILDLKVYLNFQEAIVTDDLNDSINYVSIYKIVKREMGISSHLIEHVAGRIVKCIQINFPKITHIELRLAKKKLYFGKNIKEVAVFITN